ncbi:uncharacterized protein LOC143836818 [Paroedura picta]|uniref:uncharacterized protein LOC143836818 n=1 Tax=Paroedura picta TaxID=143630 RepID=UPI0040568ECC
MAPSGGLSGQSSSQDGSPVTDSRKKSSSREKSAAAKRKHRSRAPIRPRARVITDSPASNESVDADSVDSETSSFISQASGTSRQVVSKGKRENKKPYNNYWRGYARAFEKISMAHRASGSSGRLSFSGESSEGTSGTSEESARVDRTSGTRHKRHSNSKGHKRRRSICSSPSSGLRPTVRTVLMIGHSIVYWAGQYASFSGWSQDLGLDDHLRLIWDGHRGMRWTSMLTFVAQAVHRWGFPAAVVIQLGENDIPSIKGRQLINAMSEDLLVLRHRLPSTAVFWSELLSRRTWRSEKSPAIINRAKTKINRSVSRVIVNLGGQVIWHPDIDSQIDALYRPDGVHLSHWGMDLWLHSIRGALSDWLYVLGLAGTSCLSRSVAVFAQEYESSCIRAGGRSASLRGMGPPKGGGGNEPHADPVG